MSRKQNILIYVGTYHTYMEAERVMYAMRRKSGNWDMSFETVELDNGDTELYRYPDDIICVYD